jgi:hypothetical protein
MEGKTRAVKLFKYLNNYIHLLGATLQSNIYPHSQNISSKSEEGYQLSFIDI